MGLGVDEVVPPQRLPEGHEVEQAERGGQPVPRDEAVDRAEAGPQRDPEQGVAARLDRQEAPAQAVGAAGLVGGLAGTVEVAQGAEPLRGVPWVERQQVDPPRAGAGLGGVDVLARDGQRGHRHDLCDTLLPLGRTVFDGRVPGVHVALHAQLEDDVPLAQPLGELAPQVVGIGARRLRGPVSYTHL